MKREDLENLDKYQRDTDLIVGEVYKVNRQMGIGTFSDIYEGENVENLQTVSIKLEPKGIMDLKLKKESKYYTLLQGAAGIPRLMWFGQDGDYNLMVTEILGPNIESLYNFCQRKFSVKTVLLIADQMIARLEYLHSKGVVHRDIKPENFCIGQHDQANQIYIIDFGISRYYMNQVTGQHIAQSRNKNLIGSARYASINSHYGIEQSRRDDLESVGYILIYLLKQKLPWQGLHARSYYEKYEKIKNIKINTQIEVLTQGQPNEFAEYVDYVRKLQFEEKPDYSSMRAMFQKLYFKQDSWTEFYFDWEIINKTKKIDYKKQLKGNERKKLNITIAGEKILPSQENSIDFELD